MSVKVMGLIWDAQIPDLPVNSRERVSAARAKLVLLALADHARDDGTGAYPSAAVLARKTGIPERRVYATLRALKKAGFIIPRGKSFRGTVEYDIDLEALRRLTESPPDETSPQDLTTRQGSPDVTSPEPSFNRPVNASGLKARTEEHHALPTQTPSGKKSAKKEKQQPPPAALVYRKYARLWPPKAVWEDLARIPEDDLDFWGQIVKGWIARGWNPRNVAGMLDFYRRRENPQIARRVNGTGKPAQDILGRGYVPPSQDEVDKALAEIEKRLGGAS